MTSIQTSSQFGPLHQGFAFNIDDGYTVFVGANNSGKSALLQLAFRILAGELPEVGKSKACIIFPERMYVDLSTETGARTLEDYNSELVASLQGQSVLNYSTYQNPPRSQLAKLLLTHNDFLGNLQRLNSYLEALGLPRVILKGGQQVTFEDIQVIFQGSGLRSLYSILSALADPTISWIFIDEPEISLEPKIQKDLRKLLIEASSEKKIIVATHSHLFINKENLESNYKVVKRDGLVVLEQVRTEEALFDLIFNLLGNSTEDLFMPGNYFIVEGVSDQVILEKTISLLGAGSTKVKVLSAEGVNNVKNTLFSLENIIKPFIVGDSPYASKVVALVDKPISTEARKKVAELKRLLNKRRNIRLFELPNPSIEEYLPEELYNRAGRNKATDITEIDNRRSGNYRDLFRLKAEISSAISNILTFEDLATITVIRDAVKKAIKEASE